MKPAQKEYLVSTFTRLTEELNNEQLRALCFRLDDLIQYGPEALPIAYRTINDIFNSRK